MIKIKKLEFPYDIDYLKVKGEKDTYRTIVGKYRILYLIFEDKKLVTVIKVDKRSRVYKR
ncbi:MAG: type II toxin-antitoxin system RelE/ParE family toxin [Methanosarcinales archaeon]